MEELMQTVTIIGSGPAGLTAAIYAARANLKPVVYAGVQAGGQLMLTSEVENYPGFQQPIVGPKLMQEMTEQARRLGVEIINTDIDRVDFSTKPLQLFTGNKSFASQVVIIATGATARTLGLEDEERFMGRGLSTCATCDGFFYRNKKVVVVGGGDSAMEEATYLSKICSEVVLVHRRQQFRASPIMLERARANAKIKILTPYQVTQLHGDQQGLNAITLVNNDSGASERLVIDGLFFAIGHDPNSKVFSPYIDTDDHGYIKVHHYTKTNVDGVFAAGDIADSVFRQAVTAAALGCQAAIQAQQYLDR